MEAALKHRPAVVIGERDRRVRRAQHLPESLLEFLDDGEEHLLLAVEVQIEGPAGDARTSDDVADARRPIAFACKRPDRGINELRPP